jgi:ABC-type Mn2+/Zn2+ transport system ATPase subunit
MYQSFWRRVGESACESAIYDQLKKGPVFQETIEHTILRTPLVEKIRQVITPTKAGRLYPLIVGEHGTGKTSLIKLAVNGMGEPKGVVYIDIPLQCDSEVGVINKARNALGYSSDQVIDSKDRKYSSSFR